MVGKPILYAFAAALTARGIFAAEEVVEKIELTLEANLPTDDSESVIEVEPTLSPPSYDVMQNNVETVQVEAIPDSTLFETPFLDKAQVTNMPSTNDEETQCLNICADAAFLAKAGGNLCNSADSKSFYNIAQECSKCACKVWSIFEDKDALISGLKQCSINIPSCKPEDSNISKRGFDFKGKNKKKCLYWKTVTSKRCRPIKNYPKCNSGYVKKTIKIPAATYPASKYYGYCVTYYPATTFPATSVVLPACNARKTITVKPTKPCIIFKPTCNPGYNPKTVKIASKVFPASTVTKQNVVKVYKYVSFAAYQTVVPACNKRKTTWVIPQRPSFKPTCVPGYESKQTSVPAVTLSEKVSTGNNGIVTIYKPMVYHGYKTILKPCESRKTITVEPSRPPKPTECVPGYVERKMWVPAVTIKQDIVTGQNNVVTVTKQQVYNGYYTALKPCNTRSTTTITPTRLPFKKTCAPGYHSTDFVVPATTIGRWQWIGKDNVVTLRIEQTFPAFTTALPPCQTASSITVVPPRPSITSECANGYESKTVTVSEQTFAASTVTGENNIITIYISTSYPGSTVVLPPCEFLSRTTVVPPKPSYPGSCASGFSSDIVTVPAMDYQASTITGGNSIVTVYLSTSYPAYTTNLSPCADRKTITIPQPPPPPPTQTCVVGTNSGPLTIPGTSVSGATVTGTNDVVTVYPPTTYEDATTMVPGCTEEGKCYIMILE